LVKLEEKEELQFKGEIEMADFKTVDIPAVKEKVKKDVNRGLVIDEKNNVICKKDKTITHIAICTQCKDWSEFNLEGENFVVDCRYVEKTVKQKIVEMIQSMPDFHPTHLSILVDEIIQIVKEDK